MRPSPPSSVAASRHIARFTESIKPYEPSDREDLRRFQSEQFGAGSRQCDDSYFNWLFERNPHRDPAEAVFWICKRDGIVVGQQGRVPVTLKVGDAELSAAWGVDLMVHPEWRLKGVGPALFARYEASGELLLGLGLSDAAQRTCTRSGWTDMGMLPLFARPLDLDACVDALGKRARLAKYAPRQLAPGTAWLAASAARRLRGCARERVHRFDERVDHVWRSASRDYPVLVKRDFRNLRWRFDEVPDSDRYDRYYLTHRGELVGYAVVRLDTWRGHKAARLVDSLCQRRHATALLALVIDAMRARKAVAVFLEQLSPANDQGFLRLGCVRAGAATRFMLKAKGAASDRAALLHDVSCWYVSRTDSDSDLPRADAAR